MSEYPAVPPHPSQPGQFTHQQHAGGFAPPSGPYAGPGYGYPAPMAVAPKSPGLALLASFFIPGLGSLIIGNVGKGIGIFVGYVFSLFLTVVLIGFFGIFGFWIWGMVDAYQGARRWNARHGILS